MESNSERRIIVFDKWDFLLLDFPLFHAVILLIALVVLGFVVASYVKLRFICQLIGRCPLCGKNTLYTVQRCLACKFHREHANELPQDRRSP
jgi:hypothetical protein